MEYIFYKDEPNLKIKVVTTINGEKEYRRSCKYIKGKFYRINDDCFFVAGQWYRKDSNKIGFDAENGKWELITNPNLVKGIVGFQKGVPEMGYFSANIYNNVKVRTGSHGNTSCLNSKILEDNGFFEDIATGTWHSKEEVGAASVRKMSTIRNEHSFTNKGYNIEDNAVEFERKKQTYKDFAPKLSKDIVAYGKLLGDTTFGCEVETSEGNIPENLQYQLGLVACRDGSINSAEWVTVPQGGARGLWNLKQTGIEVSKRCNIDIHCSYHVHIGNIPTDRIFMVALYILAYKMQDEIFKMFPYFKTDPRGIKKKNYCQKLKKFSIHPLKDFSKEGYQAYVDDVYTKVFTFLSDGVPPDANWNTRRMEHPIPQKWNRTSRYYWLNLQNMIFSPRHTAEFRLHTGTTNSTKMTAWLFICNAVVRYAENNIQKIIGNEGKLTMNEILDYYKTHFKGNSKAEFLSEYLKAYYADRVKVFAKDVEKGDYLSEHDMKNDKKWFFTYQGVSELF